MKKRNLLLTAIVLFSLVGCINSKTTKKTSGSSGGDSIIDVGDGDGSTGTGGTGTDLTSCTDAVVTSGASRCYYTLPQQTYSGSGKAGSAPFWNSLNNLSSSYSQEIFRTDLKFQARIRPRYATADTSFQGRKCGTQLMANFDKMQVKLMLSKTSDNGLSDNIGTFEAKVNQWSKYVTFQVPTGTTSPLVLSVYSIQTNHRCKESIYGPLATQLKTACNEGTVYFDIPVRYGNVAKTDTSVVTECVAFDIQFATDYTYSFPAN